MLDCAAISCKLVRKTIIVSEHCHCAACIQPLLHKHADAPSSSALQDCHVMAMPVQVPLPAQLNPDHPIDLHAATVAEVAAEEPANNLRKLLLSLDICSCCRMMLAKMAKVLTMLVQTDCCN